MFDFLLVTYHWQTKILDLKEWSTWTTDTNSQYHLNEYKALPKCYSLFVVSVRMVKISVKMVLFKADKT